MSLTLAVWLCLFAACAIAAIKRPVWGVALYMLTVFLAPPFWWWGKIVASYRWNLYAGLILLGSAILCGALSDRRFLSDPIPRRLRLFAILATINAVIVHYLLAPHPAISFEGFELIVKTMLLFVVLMACARSESDLKIIAISILLGAAYIGYEVTFNSRGSSAGSRLEGVGVANARAANDLACLMVCSLPLVLPLFLFGQRLEKLISLICAPLILNVILLCNSRGAFLSAIAVGFVTVLASPKALRPSVLKIACLGLVAGWMLIGDPRIIERFLTTFLDTAELDTSATSRLDFWKAGMMMIQDYPLGAGGDGFRDVYGAGYIGRVTGVATARSVHQGYLNEACEWGLQGLALRLMIIVGGQIVAFRASRLAASTGQYYVSGLALAVVAGLSGLMIEALFGTFLDDEWGLWLAALGVGCHRVARTAVDDLKTQDGSERGLAEDHTTSQVAGV